MSPDEFRSAWLSNDDELVVYPASAIEKASLPADDISFLCSAGLPKAAAPFLHFHAPDRVTTVDARWGLPRRFARYVEIGGNGSGDPICFDSDKPGQVILLNHDQGFERVYVNSSATILAEALLLYRTLVSETQRRNGPDAFLDGIIPQDLIDELHAFLESADPFSVRDRSMWGSELVELRSAKR